MKRKNLKSLKLNKKSISNFHTPSIVGGTIGSISCQPIGICAETQNCPTDGCNTNDCGTANCTNPCNPSNGCPTISCQPIGICGR